MTISRLRRNAKCVFLAVGIAAAGLGPASAQEATAPKPATEAKKAANQALRDYLNFEDTQDFEDTQRGLIDAPETLTIANENGDVVWDLESYKQYIGLDKDAPDTVNPSLWRNAQLNMIYATASSRSQTVSIRCVAMIFPTSPSSKATPAGSSATR